MTLKRFARLKDCGIFRDFHWPSSLKDFGRFNLIYGWNGSGKTTLSRILRDLEKAQAPHLGEVRLQFDNQQINGIDFPNSDVRVRVFNRESVEENVFRADRGQLPPIYVLGEESAEKQKQVEALNVRLESKRSDLQTIVAEGDAAKQNLDRQASTQALHIKEILRSSGSSKDNSYSNYSRPNFVNQAQLMAEDGSIFAGILSEDALGSLQAQLGDNPKPNIDSIDFPWPDLSSQIDTVIGILRRPVVSELIQELKDNPELSTWVNDGIEHHRTLNSDHCLFCLQPLPTGRIERLGKHFNDAFSALMQDIDDAEEEIRTSLKAVTEVEFPRPESFYDALAPSYNEAIANAKASVRKAEALQQSLLAALNKRKQTPFAVMSQQFEQPEPNCTIFSAINSAIEKHNETSDNYQLTIGNARKLLESHLLAKSFDEHWKFSQQVKRYEYWKANAEKEIKYLISEINDLERDIRQYRLPAEQFNVDLQNYLGHDELHLEVNENGYSIVRGSIPARGISEGESTAISLLYFLKTLDDSSFDVSSGIVVLDDPVSSLDSNSLFGALGYIQERARDSGQLFIFTHNFPFFSGVRSWFLESRRAAVPTEFYMLNCTLDEAGRSSSIVKLDPLLEKFESDYHYLFAAIYKAAQQTSSDLERNYNLPNMGRRLLETFLSFRQPNQSNMWQALQAPNFGPIQENQNSPISKQIFAQTCNRSTR